MEELLTGILIGIMFGACIGAFLQDRTWKKSAHSTEYIDRDEGFYYVKFFKR